MANLLIQEDKKIIARRDILTIVLVYLLGLIFVSAVGLVFLAPSFFLSQSKLDGAEDRLEILSASVQARENEETSKLLEETKVLLSGLAVRDDGFSFQETVTSVVSESPAGVSLTSFVFDRGEERALMLSIKGNAATRSSLLSLVDNLKENPRFEGVELPIGVLAKERNVEFSLSFQVISGTNQK